LLDSSVGHVSHATAAAGLTMIVS